MNPAYTVNLDFEAYAEGWTTSDAPKLTRMLVRAERYLDLLGSARPIVAPATDTFHVLSLTGQVTGGVFSLQVTPEAVTFTATNIPFNSTAAAVKAAFATAGLTVRTVGGPLPYNPVYVFYQGSWGNRFVPEGVVSGISGLTGAGSVDVTFKASGAGGVVGRRFNLAYLEDFQIQAVKNAVCAQVEYTIANPELTSGKAQYGFIKGPDFTTKGRLPNVGPQVKRELAAAGLLASMGRARY